MKRSKQKEAKRQLTAFNRRVGSQPLNAISRITGFSLKQMWRLEQMLDLRDQRSEIQHIVATAKIPTARQILIKLFLSSNGLAGQLIRHRGGPLRIFSTKYDMVTDAAEGGRLQIRARLYFEFKKTWFFAPYIPRARVKISCRLLDQQNFCEFHQEVLLVGVEGFKVRQRQGRFVTRTPVPITITQPVQLSI